jgi:hypothetical protein
VETAESVSLWVDQLKIGDEQAAAQLWDPSFKQLVQFARTQLRVAQRRAADEEDVALRAFDSFCEAAPGGRLPDLANRRRPWSLLLTITTRKAIKLVQHRRTEKQGGGAVRGNSALSFAEGRDR